MLIEAGQWLEAKMVGEEAILKCPDAALAHYNLAVAHEELQEPTEALKQYRRAVELDPQFADAHYNLAMLYELEGEGRAAIRHLSAYRKLM